MASEAFSVRARGARAGRWSHAGSRSSSRLRSRSSSGISATSPRRMSHVGSTLVGIELSDVAVLAVVAAAVVAGVRLGFSPLRRGVSIWIAGATALRVDCDLRRSAAGSNGYPWQTHAVTAAKFAEYALLAPAVVLARAAPRGSRLLVGSDRRVERRRDVRRADPVLRREHRRVGSNRRPPALVLRLPRLRGALGGCARVGLAAVASRLWIARRLGGRRQRGDSGSCSPAPSRLSSGSALRLSALSSSPCSARWFSPRRRRGRRDPGGDRRR